MNVKDEVVDLIISQLAVEPERVNLEADLMQDLNADSLDLTELIMAFEEYFEFEIPSEQAEKLRTVGDIVTYIESCKR